MSYLTACCTVKNEEIIIREWAAFHLAVGFDHLYVVDNGSTDNTANELKNLCDTGKVTLIRWNDRTPQVDIYNSVAKKIKDKYFWCAFIDADEFLYPTEGEDIKTLLKSYEDYSAIGIYWRIYGSSGHIDRPSGLTINSFTKRAEDNFIFNRHVKSIVKLSSYNNARTSHMFDVNGRMIDENFCNIPMVEPFGFFENNLSIAQKLRINHYHNRSFEDYKIKRQRGYFGVDDEKLGSQEKMMELFSAHDRNEIDDVSALFYLEKVKEIMGV